MVVDDVIYEQQPSTQVMHYDIIIIIIGSFGDTIMSLGVDERSRACVRRGQSGSGTVRGACAPPCS